MNLDQLQRGQRAIVTAVPGDDAIAQRLLEMGLLEGEEIEVLGFAPSVIRWRSGSAITASVYARSEACRIGVPGWMHRRW